MFKGLFREKGRSNGNGSQASGDGAISAPYAPPADGGVG